MGRELNKRNQKSYCDDDDEKHGKGDNKNYVRVCAREYFFLPFIAIPYENHGSIKQ